MGVIEQVYIFKKVNFQKRYAPVLGDNIFSKETFQKYWPPYTGTFCFWKIRIPKNIVPLYSKEKRSEE